MAKKLLVIDQNLAVHRLLEFTLSKTGFQISAVEDGLTGLDAAYQHQPDLIMVTSQLEGLPLPRFVQKVREREALRSVPIILMAQPNENVNLEQARQAGVTDIIKKPLDAMELNALITRCIPSTEPAAVRGRVEAATSQPSVSSTEDDQEMDKMEEMLGWVPQEGANAKATAKPTAPPPAAAKPAPAAAAPPSTADDESDLPFELQAPKPATPAKPARPPMEPITVREDAVSLEDLLITGADAMSYQPPVSKPAEPPPPPPEPEPSTLDELFASQEPIPVSKASDRSGERPAAAKPAPPRSAGASMAAPVAGSSSPPLPGGMTRQETEALIRSMVEELTRTMARETVEHLTKQIVPELAEREVQAEIERLKADSPSD